MTFYGPIVVDDTGGTFKITSLNIPAEAQAKIVADLTAASAPSEPTEPSTPSTDIQWSTVIDHSWSIPPSITLNGKGYYPESAEKPYSLQASKNTSSPIYRCEVRNNELWTGDMGGNDTERSELDGTPTLYKKGTEFYFGYQFKIEPGDDQIATAGGYPGGGLAWGCIGQIHGNGSAAAVPWQLSIQDGHLSVRTQRGAQNEKIHWTSPAPFERGRVYDVLVKIKITADSTSTMTAWIDGVQVCTSTGLAIGGNDPSFYVKCGIYRGWQGDGYPPFAVQIANIEHGTDSSLLGRLTARKDWPAVI